ncbi:hypothetical protein BAU23_20710 [Bacillus nitratireducens]|nr:hypothetical protein BAU23_20710 [Bacillus nitratireducens]
MSTLNKKRLISDIKEQEKQGFPRFKRRIARVLEEEYGVSSSEAIHVVYLPEVQEKIDSDIEWAQHMGSEFWAQEIFYKYEQDLKSIRHH